ncbi:MAG: hypothetical protein OJF50_005012 [Nitrospira sp.]|jgi:hypothetical protein|nr:hypothetical protein [Nitrospira sp.]
MTTHAEQERIEANLKKSESPLHNRLLHATERFDVMC